MDVRATLESARRRRHHQPAARSELVKIIEELIAVIEFLLEHPSEPPTPAPARAVRLLVDHQGEDAIMRDNQQVRLEVQELDSKGNAVDKEYGTPTWSVDDDTIVALTVDEDGFGALASAVGPLGTANVTLQVQLPDAEDGTAGGLLEGTVAVSVIGDDVAAEISISLGEPTDADATANPGPGPGDTGDVGAGTQ